MSNHTTIDSQNLLSGRTEVEFSAGCPIELAAKQLVDQANEVGAAWGSFNDVHLRAERGQTAKSVVDDYQAECKRRADEYARSDARKLAAKEREDRRRSAQDAHDVLMRELPRLDFGNDVAVLDWLCRMQEPSDHVGVIVKRDSIVSAFEARGFAANANCGSDYHDGDRTNMFRYLVGQALSGLKDGPAIHPIIHKFANQWRSRFARTTVQP